MDGLARVLSRPSPGSGRWPLAVALLGAAAWVLADPQAGLIAKTLVEPLAHSTSPGAAMVVLLGAAIGLAVIELDRHRPFSGWTIGAASIGLPIALLVGNAANLAAHLASLESLGMPLTMPVVHWAGESNSYSYWLHSHAGKAALAGLATPLGARGYDVGGALTAAVPGWTAPLCLASLVMASVCALPVLAAWARHASSWRLAPLFFVASLNAIKTIADGGPLSYRFVPAFAVCLAMLAWLRPPGAASRRIGLAAAMLVASAGAIGAVTGVTLESREASISLVCLLGLLAWLALPGTGRGAGAWARRAAGGLALLGWITSLIETPMTLGLPLPAGTVATVCTHGPIRCATRPVAGESAIRVYRDSGDDPLKPRHTLLHRPEETGTSRMAAVVRPVQTGAASAAIDDPAVVVQPLRALPGRQAVLVELVANGLPPIHADAPGPFTARNHQVFLHLAAARLRAQGLNAFALAPIRNDADVRRLGLLPNSAAR